MTEGEAKTSPGLRAGLLRYGMASIGPIGNAGSQFLLALLMLRQLNGTDFGTFSFLLILSQFGMGLWSALFCAPLPVLLHHGTEKEQVLAEKSLFLTNLLVAGMAIGLFALAAAAFRADSVTVWVYGVFGALTLLRWFARSHAYAVAAPLRTQISDLLYTLTVMIGLAFLFWRGRSVLSDALLVLLVATVVSFLPFGRRYARQQFLSFEAASLRAYGAIWQEHARWALTGVVTTEATVNAHAYVVTLLAGPNAFAPLAASALLTRPISVVTNALTELERPSLARHLGRGGHAEANRSVRLFRWVLLAVWALTAALGAAIALWVPHWIFPALYDYRFLAMGLGLWLLVALVRVLRSPESTFLQAAGVFRPLAEASMISCGVSLGAVALLLYVGGPLWSIAGVLAGELVFASWIWVQARRWRQKATHSAPPSP